MAKTTKKVKKDFDKEQMYRKIMPSIFGEPETAPPQPQAQAAAPDECGEAENDSPRLHNYMEDMARGKLDHTIHVLDACDCPRCRMDILAIALNLLPTAYAVAPADDDQHLQKLRGAYEVKVTASLIKAIQQVKNNPRH